MSTTRGNGKGLAWIMAHVGYSGDDCLLWPMARHSSGYGQLGVNGKVRKAHRVMCELTHGEPPTQDHHAAHNCGNAACVNPKHIEWKTQSENELDKRAHGTANRNGSRGKITREQKQEIIAVAGSAPQPDIATQYGISRSRVSEIVRDKPRRVPKGWVKRRDRYQARMTYKTKNVHLGMFASADEAHSAFLAADARVRAGLPPLP